MDSYLLLKAIHLLGVTAGADQTGQNGEGISAGSADPRALLAARPDVNHIRYPGDPAAAADPLLDGFQAGVMASSSDVMRPVGEKGV
ncbi:hypothetical protein [Candidatus Endoriftia persephonae]|jgi:hypothetical protein|uniref:Uncharacterized protein n=1 Tax=Candidatus Endoriftia persephonae TaxID=393765 RepID=A0A9J7A020_9GAMM|nr:hypothetical protein [Candidatus Endoriftia persephone]USF88176.1 hypothetical protein L0Y14_02735 [Candidatus Endoriftia persephone]